MRMSYRKTQILFKYLSDNSDNIITMNFCYFAHQGNNYFLNVIIKSVI